MNKVEINGIILSDEAIKNLAELQRSDNQDIDAYDHMLEDNANFLVRNSFDLPDREKELLSHVQTTIIIRELLHSFRSPKE